MQGNRISGHPTRRYVVALVVVIWLFVLVYALIKNPSTTNAAQEMSVMKSDMGAMLANGGVVVYRNENAKFGGALLSVLVRTDSWSAQLRDRDIKTLIDLGWQQLPVSPSVLCKNGMLADIQEDVGNYKNISTVMISMKYNATTIKSCK
jgi:hypothetical protein